MTGYKVLNYLSVRKHWQITAICKVLADQSHGIRWISLCKLKCHKPTNIISIPRALKLWLQLFIESVSHICIQTSKFRILARNGKMEFENWWKNTLTANMRKILKATLKNDILNFSPHGFYWFDCKLSDSWSLNISRVSIGPEQEYVTVSIKFLHGNWISNCAGIFHIFTKIIKSNSQMFSLWYPLPHTYMY